MIPAGGDGLTVEEKRVIARQRYGRPFKIEEKFVVRQKPKSAWLLRLERKQARALAKVEKVSKIVQIKRSVER